LRVSRAVLIDYTGNQHKTSLQNGDDLGAAKRRRLHARVGPPGSAQYGIPIGKIMTAFWHSTAIGFDLRGDTLFD
jgi:hypothetical protein